MAIYRVYIEQDDDGFEYDVNIEGSPWNVSIPFAEYELSLAKKTKRKVV